ncbi:hypothetical protein AAZV13_03G157800 [Glycine max]|uniref:AB hydrolase-1 domain-containing protein n=1 Tax=Glycine soja TaxID=3848 RepID=A0A445LEE0_GLYSO|nr:hypothetical protein D0Y65_007668 [Glycine soja]
MQKQLLPPPNSLPQLSESKVVANRSLRRTASSPGQTLHFNGGFHPWLFGILQKLEIFLSQPLGFSLQLLSLFQYLMLRSHFFLFANSELNCYLSIFCFRVDWRTVMLDMRNHGKSTERELNPPHNMENAAKDLVDLVKAEGWSWPEVVIGHSMGGKVALQFAESCSRGDYGHSALLPKQLWVLDSVPGEVNQENSNDEVRNVLATLQSLPSQFSSRKWLVGHLMGLGYPKALSDWIGTNLKKVGDHETWIFDIQNAKEMFDSYCEKSYWNLLENPPKGMEIVIVRAEKSDRWDEDAIDRIQKLASQGGSDSPGKASFFVLPNAGHWVHVDNPKGLLEIVASKIASL